MLYTARTAPLEGVAVGNRLGRSAVQPVVTQATLEWSDKGSMQADGQQQPTCVLPPPHRPEARRAAVETSLVVFSGRLAVERE